MAKGKKTKGKKAKPEAVAGNGTVRGALTLTKDYYKGKSNAGNVSLDSGDAVAKELRGQALEDVYDLASKKLGESVASLRKRYGKLNVGMQRMNLGNRLRKVLRAAA